MPVTIQTIKGEYATTLLADDGRVDPSREDREAAKRANQLPYSKLRSLTRCDDAMFEMIVTHPTFPARIGYAETGFIHRRREPVFDKAKVNEWIAMWRTIIAALPAKVE